MSALRLRVLFLPFLAACLFAASLPSRAARDEVRVLTVGNSFSDDATRLLPGFVAAGGRKLIILKASIGGCSLEKHAGLLDLALREPNGSQARAYKGKSDPRTGEKRDYTLPEALAADRWDIVTIQQNSDNSYKAETFEPHAERLIAGIRRLAPTAEILIHQTWAWREDCPKLADEKITAGEMYARLRENYAMLASRHRLRQMPVGDAFQLARQNPRWTFQGRDPDFDYANPKPGSLPRQAGSLNVGWRWTKASANQSAKLQLDYKHANVEGQYLGAAVFYEMLFEDSVVGLEYVPPGLSHEDARLLRRFAHEAVQASRRSAPPRPRRASRRPRPARSGAPAENRTRISRLGNDGSIH